MIDHCNYANNLRSREIKILQYQDIYDGKKWNCYEFAITKNWMKWPFLSHYKVKQFQYKGSSRPISIIVLPPYGTLYCDIDCSIRNRHYLLDIMITAKPFYTSRTTSPYIRVTVVHYLERFFIAFIFLNKLIYRFRSP